MAGINTKLDAAQIIKQAYDEANQRLKVDAIINASLGDVVIQDENGDKLNVNPDGSINTQITNSQFSIELSAADGDNVAISDGTNNVVVNPDGSLNVSGPLTNTQLRASAVPVSVQNPAGVTSNTWRTLKTFSVDTTTANFNSRPASGEFVTITELQPGTQQLEVLAKIKTSPSAGYKLFVWIDDGTEVYCVSPAAGLPSENSVSSQDLNGAYDGVAPVLIDLKRYTPTIKVAAQVVLQSALVSVDAAGNCDNPGFKGGEEVALSTTGVLPQGLIALTDSVDAAADTISYSGATFADGEAVTLNNSLLPTVFCPPLGIAACMDSKDNRTDTDELVLDGRVPNPFQVGDEVRIRIYGLSTAPVTSQGAITANASYFVTYSVGDVIKLSSDGIQNFRITQNGQGKIYIFKYPSEPFFIKGTNQLSRTSGGPAIDLQNEYDNVPVSIAPGVPSQVSYPTGLWVNREFANSYVFTVTAIGTAISSGAVYRVTVGSINYDFTFGNGAALGATLLRSTAATGAAPATGTLTLQSGTGPASITYTASTFGLISGNTVQSVAWAPSLNLFAAVCSTGTGNRVLTSPDGINWTPRQSAADNTWVSIVWAPEISLFVAVSNTGTLNRVMTSPDGITWTIRTTPVDNSWSSITWSGSLFVAVAITGTGNRVMTSPDGINWTARATPADLSWTAVTWAGGSTNLFVAVAATGQANRVMTSPDGINWTLRTNSQSAAGADLALRTVTWSPSLNLFVAGADGGVVSTSPDGINWTTRLMPIAWNVTNVIWVGGTLNMFFSISSNGTLNRVQTSPDGINWTARTTFADNVWASLAFSPSLNRIVAVSSSAVTNAVMTSDASSYVAHGYSAGKELIFQAVTLPGGMLQNQSLYVAANPAPTAYGFHLATRPNGMPVAFTTAGATVTMIDPAAPTTIMPVFVTAGTPGLITVPRNLFLSNFVSRFTLGGAVLPGGYVAGRNLWPLSVSAAGTMLFSANKFTPLAFTSAGTSVTLTSLGVDPVLYLQKTRAFVAQSPAPTDNNISFANTALGAALTLRGGVGSFAIQDTGPLQIKSGSVVKVRAI